MCRDHLRDVFHRNAKIIDFNFERLTRLDSGYLFMCSRGTGTGRNTTGALTLYSGLVLCRNLSLLVLSALFSCLIKLIHIQNLVFSENKTYVM